MRRSVILLAAIAGLTGVALAAPHRAAHHAAARSAIPANTWTGKIAKSADGAYSIGNPAAKVKVVEYLSYSCGHCAHFSAQGVPTLKRNYIANGSTWYEVRNAVRDRFDLAAALLARCNGAEHFMADTEALFATQPVWIAKAVAFDRAHPARPTDPQTKIISEAANGTGLIDFMAKRGLAPARAQACLANKAELDTVMAMTNDAFNVKHIPGTPGVFVNGMLAGSDWASVNTAINAALAAN